MQGSLSVKPPKYKLKLKTLVGSGLERFGKHLICLPFAELYSL